MIRTLSIGLILILGISFIQSCVPEQPTPDQEKIYLELALAYNKSQSKTTASALFKQDDANGSPLELSNPANVTYASNLLIYSTTEKWYKKEFIGRIESEFVYTDLDSDVISNTMVLNDSIGFLALADSHSITTNLIIPITAPNFLSNERLEVELLDLNTGFIVLLNSDDIPSTDMMIETDHLSQIGIGEMVITLRRIKEVTTLTQSKLAGGELKICYEVSDTISLY